MDYKAVLFDLDGTLLDTLEDLADSANAVLAEEGFATHSTDAYRYFVGDGARNLITRCLPPEHRDEQTVSRSLARYRDVYARNWNVKTRAYPGIAELLDALSRRGLKLAVLSNKPDEFTQRCVADLLPRWRFDTVLGATEQFPHKPDPASALEVARRLEVRPAQFLYLGDTATDMRTALSAGMFAAGALWGFRTADELTAAGAKVLVSHPLDVVGLL